MVVSHSCPFHYNLHHSTFLLFHSTVPRSIESRLPEKIANTANIGPELEVMIKSGQLVGPLGSPDLGGLGTCSPRKVLNILKCLLVHSESSFMQSLHKSLIARSVTML